jgi:SAM-dependent methyltransferase
MTWDDKWRDEKTIGKWLTPDPGVEQLVRERRTHETQRALDLGCGPGRHVVLLARHGYETHGSDFSPAAVEHCRRWLRREGLSATVRQGDMADIRAPDGFFDLIVAFNVIYHTTWTGMKEMAALLRRKLRPGGCLFVTLKSPATWYFGRGRQLEPGTFLRPPKRDRPTKDIPVHFSTEEEADELFSAFHVVSKRHVEQVPPNGKRLARWELTLNRVNP